MNIDDTGIHVLLALYTAGKSKKFQTKAKSKMQFFFITSAIVSELVLVYSVH